MKKKILISILVILSSLLPAQVLKNINVSSVGTLKTLLTSTEKTTVTNLAVTGTIDARDIKFIRDSIRNLTELDIINVTILEYNGYEGTSYPNPFDQSLTITHYPANELPTQAFAGIRYLKSIKLPYSITSIEWGALQVCPELSSIVIPNQVKTIVGGTFYNCYKLSSVSMCNSVITLGDGIFANCEMLTDLTLSDSLKTIGGMAFGCKALRSIKIPKSVTFIGTDAFFNTSFTSIYSYPTVPVDLTSSISVFSGVNKSTCVLYVPKGSKTLYQTADQWKDFTNIVEMTTGIVPFSKSDIKIKTDNGNLIVENAKAGDKVEIFSITGVKIKEQLTKGYQTKIKLQRGIYLIRVDNYSDKVSIK
ncbi:MAG: leucine-rich repeat domain-containing protein [Paludibacter sp.]